MQMSVQLTTPPNLLNMNTTKYLHTHTRTHAQSTLIYWLCTNKGDFTVIETPCNNKKDFIKTNTNEENHNQLKHKDLLIKINWI